MTSSSAPGDAAEAKEAGFNGYIVSPCARDILAGVLGLMLQGGHDFVTRHTLREAFNAQQVSKAKETDKPFDGVDILLAEDNKINQRVAKLLLTRLGAKVTVADDGEMAVAKLKEKRPDLVLMDVQMPGMDGFQATEAIRQEEAGQKGQRLPIIALTANAMAGDRERCLAVGMDDYLSKPLREKDLIPVVSRWLPAVQGHVFEES